MAEFFANTTLSELTWYGVIGVIVLSGIIQISPIKINPWSWLGRKISSTIRNWINGEVLVDLNGEIQSMKTDINTEIQSVKDDIAMVKADVKGVQDALDERDAKQARIQILRFGDEVREGRTLSKEHFDEILQSSDEYDQYCRDHPLFKNHRTERTMKLIIKAYDEHLENNNFE